MMDQISNFWQLQTPILSILIPAFAGFILLLLGSSNADNLQNDNANLSEE